MKFLLLSVITFFYLVWDIGSLKQRKHPPLPLLFHMLVLQTNFNSLENTATHIGKTTHTDTNQVFFTPKQETIYSRF